MEIKTYQPMRMKVYACFFFKNVKAGRPGRNFNLEEKNYFSICLPAISQRKIEQMHV